MNQSTEDSVLPKDEITKLQAEVSELRKELIVSQEINRILAVKLDELFMIPQLQHL